MATENQLIKLEKIQKITNPLSNKEIPKALSRGHIGYEKALKSIMVAGEWAIVSAVLAVAATIVFLATKQAIFYVPLKDYEIYLSVFTIICSITSGVLGYKLWNLEATPIFALTSLLVILVCNLFLSIGIIPFITVICVVIALTRYHTFCVWFQGIK